MTMIHHRAVVAAASLCLQTAITLPFRAVEAFTPSYYRVHGNNVRTSTFGLNHGLLASTTGSTADASSSALNNWIERIDPLGVDTFFDNKQAGDGGGGSDQSSVAYFSLGISGSSYELGTLSQMFNTALLKQANNRFADTLGEIPDEMLPIYATFAMDCSAKEASRLALEQNGMELIEMEDQLWGEVENIRLTGSNGGEVFDTLQDAVENGQWKPGQDFDCVVRNVKARVSIQSDMGAANLNAAGANTIDSLEALAADVDRRCNASPREASMKGYAPWKAPDIVPRSDLSLDAINFDGSENEMIGAEVMDALRNHGYLIVDVNEGMGLSESEQMERSLASMWKSTENFFDAAAKATEEGGGDELVPAMQVAEGVGSRHAVFGYTSYDEGSMRFLETRVLREEQSILPSEMKKVLNGDDLTSLLDSFHVLADIGKDIVRLAVATSSVEKEAFLEADATGFSEDGPSIAGLSASPQKRATEAAIKAASAALRLVDELVDDGRPCMDLPIEESPVSMSPHRMCRYSGSGKTSETDAKEVFGAHTDTSFITMIPVAAVSGLEVFDESANTWVRPEIIARRHFEEEREGRGLDPNVDEVEVTINDITEKRPWHARYSIAMPGELLQIVSRGSINAAVHRVVAAVEGQPRLSAPVLLRARTKATMQIQRYFIDESTDDKERKIGKLLQDCEGMTMYDIHDRLQPGKS